MARKKPYPRGKIVRSRLIRAHPRYSFPRFAPPSASAYGEEIRAASIFLPICRLHRASHSFVRESGCLSRVGSSTGARLSGGHRELQCPLASKVWHRFHHDSLADLQLRSSRYIQAHRRRLTPRIEAAPRRHSFPPRWRWREKAPLAGGKLIYLRRTNDRGAVSLLGHRFKVHPSWTHRLVRCEVNCTDNKIHFFALRRRDPAQQPLLNEIHYELKQKWLRH